MKNTNLAKIKFFNARRQQHEIKKRVTNFSVYHPHQNIKLLF